jgi:hypothetical protein
VEQMGRPETEIFPKQDRLEHSGQYGNFINLPLFGQFVLQGKMVFVDELFEPYPDQIEFLSLLQRVSEEHLDFCLSRIPSTTQNHSGESRKIVRNYDQNNGLINLLPCAVRMLGEGVRFNQRVACFRLAYHLRRSGVAFEKALSQLNRWALRNSPPPGKGIIRTSEILSQAKFAYQRSHTSFGCEDAVMQSFCDPNCVIKSSRKSNSPRKYKKLSKCS